MGDEIGLCNNYDYRQRPEYANDSRWIHRSALVWQRLERAVSASISISEWFDTLSSQPVVIDNGVVELAPYARLWLI